MSGDIELDLTDTFNHEGEEYNRGSALDFKTLNVRVWKSIFDATGIDDNDTEMMDKLTMLYRDYQFGNYPDALESIEDFIDLFPKVEPYFAYYKRVCERTRNTELLKHEKHIRSAKTMIENFEKRQRDYEKKPFFMKWLIPEPTEERFFSDYLIICKWCGHYTEWVDPNESTIGFASHRNSCSNCGTMYPAPDWIWDSPQGRAYSYYRMSFGDQGHFYEEFERDFNPSTKCQSRQMN